MKNHGTPFDFNFLLKMIKLLPKEQKLLISKEIGKDLNNQWMSQVFRTYTKRDMDN
jgi:hypothetical protein